MHLKLKVLRGASSGKEIAVAGPRFFIGRSEECHLRANSDAISRRHCAITVVDDVARIRDLKSRNGTYVNGVRIEGDHRIQVGDQLRVGPLEFLVTYLKSAPAPVATKVTKGSPASDDEMAGLIDDWLSEAEELDPRARVVDTETREFRLDETDRIDLQTGSLKPSGSSVDPVDRSPAKSDGKGHPPSAAEGSGSSSETSTEGPEESAETSRQESQRSPMGRRAAAKSGPPKDTQEAAAQTLRKFFNRGS